MDGNGTPAGLDMIIHMSDSPVGLCLGIILFCKFAKHFSDFLLRNFVTDPAVCSLMSGCCASVDPAKVGKESFGLGLTVASLLPHADGILAVPLRHPLDHQCLLNNSERIRLMPTKNVAESTE